MKRCRNLKALHSSHDDQEYYKEIGGLEGLEEMKRRPVNNDSIPKGAQQAFLINPASNMDVDHTDIDLQQTILDDVTRNQRQANLNINHNMSNSNRNDVTVDNVPHHYITALVQCHHYHNKPWNQKLMLH